MHFPLSCGEECRGECVGLVAILLDMLPEGMPVGEMDYSLVCWEHKCYNAEAATEENGLCGCVANPNP